MVNFFLFRFELMDGFVWVRILAEAVGSED